MASQPGSGPYAFDNLPGLKELRKRVRLANLEERSERSKLYADVLSLINSFYPHGGAAWRKTTELLPRGGREDSGGSYLPAAIIFTALKRMLRDDRTRTNGLMLIRRIAKLSGSITQDYRPVLQGLSKALDFPLDIHAASKGTWDMIDVTDKGIAVRSNKRSDEEQTDQWTFGAAGFEGLFLARRYGETGCGPPRVFEGRPISV